MMGGIKYEDIEEEIEKNHTDDNLRNKSFAGCLLSSDDAYNVQL